MVSEGGATGGLGAGCTSGFLIAGSGNCADGGGFCCAGSAFCPRGAGLASGGGVGFCGVACGFACDELCPDETAGCEATLALCDGAGKQALRACSAPKKRRKERLANAVKLLRTRRRNVKTQCSPLFPGPRRGIQQDTLSAAQQNKK